MARQSSRSPVDELLVAQFEALLGECDLIDTNEHTLDNMELFFLDKGRKLLQETFQQKLQERIKHVENTDEPKQCPDCKKKRNTKTKRRKA